MFQLPLVWMKGDPAAVHQLLQLGSLPSGDVVNVILCQEAVSEKSETDGKIEKSA